MDSNQIQRVKIQANLYSKQQGWLLEKEIKKIKPEALALIESSAMKSIICTMHALYALSLNSLYGFGAERTNKLIESVMNQFICVRDEFLSPDDIRKWCEEHKINYMRNEV